METYVNVYDDGAHIRAGDVSVEVGSGGYIFATGEGRVGLDELLIFLKGAAAAVKKEIKARRKEGED